MEKQKQDIRKYLETMKILNENTDDYFFLWDLKAERAYFSGKLCEKYNLEQTEDGSYGRLEWETIVYSRDLPAVREELERIMAGEIQKHNMEYRLIDRRGNRIWINSRGTIQADPDGQPAFMLGRLSDTVMNSHVDFLTGLQNGSRCARDMKHCLNTGGSGYLLVLGIDNFKNVNIKYGRNFGNRVLKKMTEALETVVDPSLSLYRLDGDRFAVNLRNREAAHVQDIYNHLQNQMQEYCTLSAGAASYGDGSTRDYNTLYQYAETAMDRAKRSGKNNLYFFSAEDYERSLSMINLQDELNHSVKNGCQGFFLCYQPQVDSHSCQIRGAEALLRYRTRDNQVLSPVEFIPILEQTGLICPVGLWVLETALKQCRIWRQRIPDLRISVNISYAQLRQPEIAGQVLETIQASGVPGTAITLEVTESMQLQDYRRFNAIFNQWGTAGVQIAIDDFGTGYSSLSYLKSLEVDEVKVDRCFVREIQNSTYNFELMKNIIELSHSAQIRVCCEGVEKEEELTAVRRLNPDLIQGFLFDRPLPPEELEEVYIRDDSARFQERIRKQEYYRNLEVGMDNRLQELLYYKYGDILKRTRMGLWIIRINPETGLCQLFADSTMLSVLGVEQELSPEDCYRHWYDRINDGYYYYVNRAVETIIETGRLVQVEYTWNHPRDGEVVVRCVGIRMADSDGMVCLEGYHRIISDMEQSRFLPDASASIMFEYNERKASIYFHTGRGQLFGEAVKETGFPECWVEQQIVHPYFAEEFCELFRNVDQKKDVQPLEILLKNCYGMYEWFRLGTRHLRTRDQDIHTVVVLIDPAGQERVRELERMREKDFYEVMLSETIAHAEVNLDTGALRNAGGLWEPYGEICREDGGIFTSVMQKNLEQIVFPEDLELCRRELDVNMIRERYQDGQSTSKSCFRRRMDGKLIWVQLVVHAFQERYTDTMYALLYLKNIDMEKRRELAREIAANQDPLTNIDNRRTFERKVRDYMECGEKLREEAWKETEEEPREDLRCGTFLLLDLDEFKQINDQYGHQQGDRALMRMAKLLLATFRKEDLIGRLGGDEFVVFIKGVCEPKTVERRMEQLMRQLNDGGEMSLACSAGITFVSAKDFSYEEMFRQADVALYVSKQKGRQTYSYYEGKQ